MKQNLAKTKKETATDRIRKKINELCLKHSFITWDMIGVDPYTRTGRHRLTYEGGIVYKIMSDLNIEYVRYGDVFNELNYHKNTKGFSNTLLRRIEKINNLKERINEQKQLL